jgi:hypothetical protein
MRTHATHLAAPRIAAGMRAHAIAWLIAALIGVAAAASLTLALASGSGGSGVNRPSASPASYSPDYEYPPAQRLSSGKYLYP